MHLLQMSWFTLQPFFKEKYYIQNQHFQKSDTQNFPNVTAKLQMEFS